MSGPLCYVGIAMHPEARKILETQYDITENNQEIGKCTAAISYGIPDEWMNPGMAPMLRSANCHSCSEAFRKWTEKNGIALTLADGLWRTVAEHTLALMLAACRDVPQADRDIRAGLWNDHVRLKVAHSGWDLQGKTLGILGMGQIGRELADMVRGFRMNVIYYDIAPLPAEKEAALGVRLVSREELLGQADILCMLLPLNEQTRGNLDQAAFAAMKEGVILINTARAGLIDEEAFLEAMEIGKVRAAGLDVFWDEAKPQKERLLCQPHVVLAPHLGGSTFECDMQLVHGALSILP